MKHADFTELASHYHNRAGYSLQALNLLATHIGARANKDFLVADVGAGTGKLTENLVELELSCVAVEPNDAMRETGKTNPRLSHLSWTKGSAEDTGLPTASVNWVLMASSFHWVDVPRALNEFRRILRPGGFFTALWNPRDLEASTLHTQIEARIHAIAPHIQRKSSGASQYTTQMWDTLVSDGLFKDPIFVESRHSVTMTKERYISAWRSVNDIQVQVGPQKFEEIIQAITEEIAPFDDIDVPYRTRSWTVQRVE